MTWTQQQYSDQLTALLDSAGSQRWGTVESLNALTISHRREWLEILKRAPSYRLQVLTLATDANGQIPLASLTTGGADVKKRFFQVITKRLYNGTVRYERARPIELAFALGQPTQSTSTHIWWRADSYLQFLPVATGLVFNIPVNHYPSAMNLLSGTGVAVEFPEDYEQLVVYSAAALLFAKGDLETKGTADFATIASTLRESLLSEVLHLTAEDMEMRAGDDPADWGS